MAEKVALYAELGTHGRILTQLVAGDEIRLGAVTNQQGQDWVQVSTASGQQGFIPGSTKVKSYQYSTVMESAVSVYASPSLQAPIRNRLTQGAKVFLVDVVQQDGKDWVRIRDRSGAEGFIAGGTKIAQATGFCTVCFSDDIVRTSAPIKEALRGIVAFFGAGLGTTILWATVRTSFPDFRPNFIMGALVFGCLFAGIKNGFPIRAEGTCKECGHVFTCTS
jgi:hypothetical protein